MLKILQASLGQYMNQELPDVQAGFKEVEEPEIKLPTFVGSWRKQGSSRKTATSVSLTMQKPLKRWECETTLPAFGEICMWVKK